MVVYPANNKLSSWRYIMAFPCLFLVSSRLGLAFFLFPHKQNEKLNFSWPIETQSRMLARLSRPTRQHPGQSTSLRFCSATDLEVQFDKTLRRAWHNDSLCHPLHTMEGDEISMFWGPCLQSSISRLSFSFLALFFCYAVSSCVYDHNHPYLVSERLFLAENEAFPYLRRALAHLRRALAILWDAAATWPVVIFVVVAAKQRSPKMSVACVQGPVDRFPYRSPPVTLNGHCGVIF